MKSATSSELMRSLLDLAEKKSARRTGEHRIPSPEAIQEALERAAAQKAAPPQPPAPPAPPSVPVPTADGLSLAEIQHRVVLRTAGASDAANRVADLMCIIAQADGSISEAEREALGRVLKVLMGSHLHDAVIRHLIRSSLREIASDGIEKRLKLIAQVLLQHGIAEEGLALAISIGYAGEGVTAPERAVLKLFANQIAVTPARFDLLLARVTGELKGKS